MKATDIHSQKSLATWLQALPADLVLHVATVIAGRAAHRILPLSLPRREHIDESDTLAFLNMLRANSIVRVAGRSPLPKLVEPAREAARVLASLSGKKSPMRVTSPHAAVSVVAASSNDYAIAQATGAVHAASQAAAGAVLNTAGTYWKAVQNDAVFIEGFKRPIQLNSMPIWARKTPSWLERRNDTVWRLLSTGEFQSAQFQIWQEWYESIASGKPAFNLPKDPADDLELRIALGDDRKGFWDRKPSAVNAEIASWVNEARASLVFAEEQTSGLQFEWRDGLVRLTRGLGLSSPKDDQHRIEAQLPVLLELVTKLEAHTIHGDVPRPEALVWAVTNLKKTIARKDRASISATELFTATAILRSQIEQAKTPAMGTNLFALDGPDLALLQSIALTSDMIVLATEEGRKLFDDADRAETDAGELDRYRELEKQLFAIIATNGSVVEASTVELLRKVLLLDRNSPHPKRMAYLSAGSVRNAILVTSIVSLTGAVGYALVSVTVSSAMAAAAMTYIGKLVFGEGFKKSKLGEMSNHTITNAINKVTARVVIDNRELLRKIAGDRPSYKSLRDLLDWVDEEEKNKIQKE